MGTLEILNHIDKVVQVEMYLAQAMTAEQLQKFEKQDGKVMKHVWGDIGFSYRLKYDKLPILCCGKSTDKVTLLKDAEELSYKDILSHLVDYFKIGEVTTLLLYGRDNIEPRLIEKGFISTGLNNQLWNGTADVIWNKRDGYWDLQISNI